MNIYREIYTRYKYELVHLKNKTLTKYRLVPSPLPTPKYRDWVLSIKDRQSSREGPQEELVILGRHLLLDRLKDVEHLPDVPVLGLEQVGQPAPLVGEAHVHHGLQRHLDPRVGVDCNRCWWSRGSCSLVLGGGSFSQSGRGGCALSGW